MCKVSSKVIAELAELSPIIIQNSSNPSGRKNLDVRLYDSTTERPFKVLLLTCVVNCTEGTPTPRPVIQWSVHWAPSQTTRVLVLARTRRCALETCGEKKCELRFSAWLNLYINDSKNVVKISRGVEFFFAFLTVILTIIRNKPF